MAFDSESYFWNQVSGSDETERKTAALIHGKVASATWWPFLSHAGSEREFEDRLSLVSNKIESSVDPEVYPDVISSLRDDYRAVHEASRSSAQSTSPELAEFNDGIASRQADLNADEYFNATTGSWEKLAKSDMRKAREDEPSSLLNNPDQYNPYSNGERKQCVSCNGWGRFDSHDGPKCGHCDGKGYIDLKKKATNYQPDPNAAWRYHQPYQNIDGANQVNNGALQDSDGFPTDLAQGEYEGAQQRMQFQLTPGTWTAHDGMPERPMEMSKARGYQPVAGKQRSAQELGWHHSDGPEMYRKGFEHGDTGQEQVYTGHADYLMGHRDGSEGHQWRQREAGMDFRKMINGSDEPETALDPHYNEVPEIRGTSRTKGTFDGPIGRDLADEEKRRSQTKSSSYIDQDGFLVEALVDPAPGAAQKVNPFYFNTEEAAMGSNQGFPVDPSVESNEGQPNRASEYGEVPPQASSGSTEGTIDGNGYSRSHPGESPNFSERTSARDDHSGWAKSFWDMGARHANDGLPPKMHDLPDSQHEAYLDGYKNGHAGKHRVPEGTGLAYDAAKTAATDGKIVDHCPGCDKPRRNHDTPHGTEVRHLHNDHVRCHGDRTAKKKTAAVPHPVTTITHPEQGSGEPYRAACEQCGPVASHHDYDMVHAIASDHQNQHWVSAHDDQFGQGAHEREFPWMYQGSVNSLPQFFDPTLSSGSAHTAADYLGRPTAENPNGTSDDYQRKTWDAQIDPNAGARPLQPAHERGANGPTLNRVRPMERHENSPRPGTTIGQGEREEDDEEEED